MCHTNWWKLVAANLGISAEGWRPEELAEGWRPEGLAEGWRPEGLDGRPVCRGAWAADGQSRIWLSIERHVFHPPGRKQICEHRLLNPKMLLHQLNQKLS